MNMQNLMAQAQKIQKDLEKANSEIESSEFEGTSGAVKVKVSGKNEVIKVEIIDSSILSDKEMLEDMILACVNEAINKADELEKELKPDMLNMM